METSRISTVLNNLTEYFSSAWTLLSDTTIFLTNNTKIFHHYENHLRELRHRLESNRNNHEVIHEVRKEVAEIRKSLRLQGYNLKLGSLDLKLEGFRNDDAIAQGFKRCVLFLLDDGNIQYITGMSNHIELDAALEARTAATGYHSISQKHYLWFKWRNRVLILSGAASESRDDFDNFRDYVEEYRSSLVRKLSRIS